MTNIISGFSGIGAKFLDPTEDPSVMAMALELMNVDTATESLKALTGSSTVLTQTLQQRAKVMAELFPLIGVNPPAPLSADLVAELDNLGLSVSTAQQQTPATADLQGWYDTLSGDQLQDEMSLKSVAQNAYENIGRMQNLSRSTNQLLEQYAPSHIQPPVKAIDHWDSLDIIRTTDKDASQPPEAQPYSDQDTK